MSEKHTQGRLTVNPIRLDQICTEDGSACIAVANRDGAHPLTVMANARRLVACWNACLPIPDEHLDLLAEHYEHQKQEIVKLQAQRDELLALVRSAIAWWEEHQFDTTSVDGEERNVYDEEPAFVSLARAAIAKVRGGAA